MPEVMREDIQLFFVDEGDGRAVLLIHGHTLDHRVWAEMVPVLHGAGLRTIAPDLRGHGRSGLPPKGYHWSDHAADMEAVLDAAGVEQAEVAEVVGFSLGGGIALGMALTRPKRVASLALIAPVMPDRPFEPAFMDSIKKVARRSRAAGISAAMSGPWMESPLFAYSFSKPGVRDRVAEMVGDFPGADYVARERDQVEQDWTVPERLGDICVPTLVLVGAREMAGFESFAKEAATGIPGACLEVVPDSGHLLPLEEPRLLARHITDHLG
jgi:3-oxoadipate enol-lactonase